MYYLSGHQEQLIVERLISVFFKLLNDFFCPNYECSQCLIISQQHSKGKWPYKTEKKLN